MTKLSTKRQACIHEISDDEVLTFLEGPEFDKAIIGVCYRFGFPAPVVAYDREKCIAVLQKMGMNEEEALEYFDFNTIGAWMGEGTPVFITRV